MKVFALVATALLACGLLASSVQADQNYGIPPHHPDFANPDPSATRFSPVRTTVAKAKQEVSLTDLRMLTYANYCLRLDFGYGFELQTCCPNPFDTSTCPKNSIVEAPHFKDGVENSGSISWTMVNGPTWVHSPAGAPMPYGQFPPVRVNMVGFGSIPVTATAHMSQAKGSDGLYEGMDLDYTLENTSLSENYDYSWDDVSLDGGWGSPSPELPRTGIFFSLPAHITGAVNIRISDVEVDGVPLDVGSECRTVTPGQLELKQAGGYYDGNSDPNDRTKNPLGTPGAWFPLASGLTRPSSIPGSVSIPAFSGCQSGGEDLDPLMTGLVSGPNNDVVATQTMSITLCGAPTDPECSPYEQATNAATPAVAAMRAAPAGLPKADAPVARSGAISNSVAKSIAKLTPKQLKAISSAISKLKPQIRRQVTESLPPELIQAIKE